MMKPFHMMLAGLAMAGLSACEEGSQNNVVLVPTYLGIETRKLDAEIVSFLVRMEGARGNEDLADYGKCAAAQYALIRGYGFARHIRTNVQERAGLWAADAVYTISASLPEGLQTIDAEVVVEDCAQKGIPTV